MTQWYRTSQLNTWRINQSILCLPGVLRCTKFPVGFKSLLKMEILKMYCTDTNCIYFVVTLLQIWTDMVLKRKIDGFVHRVIPPSLDFILHSVFGLWGFSHMEPTPRPVKSSIDSYKLQFINSLRSWDSCLLRDGIHLARGTSLGDWRRRMHVRQCPSEIRHLRVLTVRITLDRP